MELTQAAALRLSESVRVRIERLWSLHESDQISRSTFRAAATSMVAQANQAGVQLADIGLAAEATRQLHTPAAPLGLRPSAVQVDADRIVRDVDRILDEIPSTADPADLSASRRERLGAWARTEPLLTVATATQAGMVARGAGGWVRQLDADPCRLCIRWADGVVRAPTTRMKRHNGCVVAGSLVAGPSTVASTRRWYRGQVTTIRAASGNLLTLTVNHPVLTDRGWVPAGFITEGDYVVSGAFGKGTFIDGPHEQQVPSLVEDVAASLSMTPHLVPGSPEDFHGDGADGEVDIVWSDRFLRDGLTPPILEQFRQGEFVLGYPSALVTHRLDRRRSKRTLSRRRRATTGRCVCGRELRGNLVGRQSVGRNPRSFPLPTNANVPVYQPLSDRWTSHSVGASQPNLTLTRQVSGTDLIARDVDTVPRGVAGFRRFDPPPAQVTTHDVRAASERGRDLLHRLAGLVELDRVIDVTVGDLWSGHVYNLMTVEGWYEANGLIVSNCGCIQVPQFT